MKMTAKGLHMMAEEKGMFSQRFEGGVPAKVVSWFGYAAFLASAFALAGCVTINIYFPAAAAEKAADRIIDEVWQLKEGGAPVTVKPAPEEKK